MACSPKPPPDVVTRQIVDFLTDAPGIHAYSTPIIDRMTSLPGGKKLAAMARTSFQTAARFQGEMKDTLESLGHQLGVGGWAGGTAILGRAQPSVRGARGRRVRDWLNGAVPLEDGSGAIARSVDLMNRPITKADIEGAPPGTWGVLQAMREATLRTGKFMEESGLQIRAKKGWIPFKADVDGNRMTRMLNVEGQHLFETGDSDLAAAIAAANGMPLPEAEALVDEIKKSAVLRRSPMESMRRVPIMPTHVRKGGKLVQIMETDPWVWANRAVHTTSMRGAAVRTFGQDTDVRPTNAVGTTNPVLLTPLFGTDDPAVIQEAVDSGALDGRVVDAKAKELERFVRAVNGQPITVEDSLSPKQAKAVEAMNLSGAVVKTGLLSKSALVNLPETMGATAAFTGWWNTARATVEVITGPALRKLGFKIEDRMEMAREIGAVHRDLLDTYVRPGRMMQSLAQGVRGTGGRLTLSHAVNKMNEYIAAVSAQHFVQGIKTGLTGRSAEMARARLLLLGYTPGQAATIVEGRARQEMLDGIVRRAVEQSLGTTSMQGERSVAAAHPLWSRALWFSSFNQMKTNRTLRQVGLFMDAIRSRKVLTPAERGDILAMGQLMGMQFTGSLAAVATANLLRAFALYGIWGLLAEWEREADTEYVLEYAWSAFGGGPAEAVASGFASGDTTEEGVGNAFIRAVAPLSVAKNLLEAVSGAGRYRDQSGFERATMFLESQVPATGVFQTLAWSLGLYQKDPAYDAARKSYWTWRRENGIMPPKVTTRQDKGEDDNQAKIHIKNAWELLQKGEDLTGEAMARELSLALGFKAKSNAFELFESKDAITTALRNRKYWRDQADWTAEQQAQARTSLGPVQSAKLDEHDRSIDLLISALEISVGEEYRPPLERTQDQIEREQAALRLMGDFEAAWPATAEAYARENNMFAALRNFDLDRLPEGLGASDRADIAGIQRAGLAAAAGFLKESAVRRDRGATMEAHELITRVERETQRSLDAITRVLQRAVVK